MGTYLSHDLSLIHKFKGICIEHVVREHNSHTDAFAGLASSYTESGPRFISIRTINKPNFELNVLVHKILNIDLDPSWMGEIVSYLGDNILPSPL